MPSVEILREVLRTLDLSLDIRSQRQLTVRSQEALQSLIPYRVVAGRMVVGSRSSRDTCSSTITS